MKKLFLVLATATVLVACKDKKAETTTTTTDPAGTTNTTTTAPTGWSDADKTAFRASCEPGAKATAGVGEAKATAYCDCIIGKMESMNMAAASVSTMDTAMTRQMRADCMK